MWWATLNHEDLVCREDRRHQLFALDHTRSQMQHIGDISMRPCVDSIERNERQAQHMIQLVPLSRFVFIPIILVMLDSPVVQSNIQLPHVGQLPPYIMAEWTFLYNHLPARRPVGQAAMVQETSYISGRQCHMLRHECTAFLINFARHCLSRKSFHNAEGMINLAT